MEYESSLLKSVNAVMIGSQLTLKYTGQGRIDYCLYRSALVS